MRHRREDYSRNPDAHDVPLDGAEVTELRGRLLDRAETVGGQRARDYLSERLDTVRDRWNAARQASSRLGYQAGSHNRQQLRGLITPAGNGEYTELTVARSMRETENEINLLVPATNLFAPAREEEWSYSAPTQDEVQDDTQDTDATPGAQ